jgi:arsenate reductase
MSRRPRNVLFLCTGNSARSVLAEALLRHWGGGRFVAFSAGSRPKGQVNPLALELLRGRGLSTDDLSSKSWDEFAGPEAPVMDIVVTVCDSAAGEACPLWPGAPVTVHWGIDDPAAATGTLKARRAAFRAAYRDVEARVRRLAELPFEWLDATTLEARLAEIGRAEPEAGS